METIEIVWVGRLEEHNESEEEFRILFSLKLLSSLSLLVRTWQCSV